MASLLRGTAFITGAASGIGQYTALSFARHGIKRLALADVNAEVLRAANSELKSKFPSVEVLALQLDVRKTNEVRDGIAETMKKFGRLDVAVNNAGIGGSGRKTHELDEEEFARVADVNLSGVWRCQREELKVMVEQESLGEREGRGRIVNVSSMFGIVAPPENVPHTAYTTAKHGVIGLTRGDANTYASQQIRINAVCPGYVATPLIKATMNSDPGSPLMLGVERTPMKRLATMEEIGDTIAFLASPMSSFMTGAVLVADGGYSSN